MLLFNINVHVTLSMFKIKEAYVTYMPFILHIFNLRSISTSLTSYVVLLE
jgi:hypothetical protein